MPRDLFLSAYVALRTRAVAEDGQTASEYMGILLVAAVLVAAVLKSGAADVIEQKVSDLVDAIAGGKSPR